MAFTDEEQKKWDKRVSRFIEEHRPPENVRSQVDLSYSMEDQSIVIFEIRPRFDKPEEKTKEEIAKTTWVRRRQIWKIYWQQADLKWHKYDPRPEVGTLDDFLDEVDKDPYACFWG